jgi:hypothetical protein
MNLSVDLSIGLSNGSIVVAAAGHGGVKIKSIKKIIKF